MSNSGSLKSDFKKIISGCAFSTRIARIAGHFTDSWSDLLRFVTSCLANAFRSKNSVWSSSSTLYGLCLRTVLSILIHSCNENTDRFFCAYSIAECIKSHSIMVCPGTKNLCSITSIGNDCTACSSNAQMYWFRFCPQQLSEKNVTFFTFSSRLFKYFIIQVPISLAPRLPAVSGHK